MAIDRDELAQRLLARSTGVAKTPGIGAGIANWAMNAARDPNVLPGREQDVYGPRGYPTVFDQQIAVARQRADQARDFFDPAAAKPVETAQSLAQKAQQESGGPEAPFDPSKLAQMGSSQQQPMAMPMMPAAAPVKRKMVTTGLQIQHGPERSQAAIDAQNDMDKSGRALSGIVPAAERAEQVQKSDELGEILRNANEKRAGVATLEGRQAADLQAAKHEVWKAKDEYEHAPASVSEMWKQKGTGEKIGLAIALALSGAAAGWSGKENPLMKHLEDSLKTDLGKKSHLIDMSQDQVEKLKGEQKDAYSQAMQHYADGLAASEAEVQQRAAMNLDDPRLQKRAAEVAYAIDAKRAEASAKLDEVYGGRVTEHRQLVTTGRGMPKSQDPKLYVPRAGGIASDETISRELVQAGSGYEKVDRILAASMELRKNPDSFVPGTKVHNELLSLQAQLNPAIQESNNFKRMTDADIHLNNEMVGSLTSPLAGTDARIANLRAQKQAEEQSRYKSSGIMGAQSQYYMAPDGSIQRYIGLTGQDYAPPQARGGDSFTPLPKGGK